MLRVASAAVAALAASLVASPAGVDAPVARGSGLVVKKAHAAEAAGAEVRTSTALPGGEPATSPTLATLVQTHTDERIVLDDAGPSPERFAALLADRVTGERKTFDPKLLELLRALARRHPSARVELVSGYRSAKLNEMMRKKGRHVASHSQHSLGHAVDFRIVPAGAERGIDPRELEAEIRGLGWEGGIGVYTLSSDWFVHCDVGRKRRWTG